MINNRKDKTMKENKESPVPKDYLINKKYFHLKKDNTLTT